MYELMEFSLIRIRINITDNSLFHICVLEVQHKFVCSEVMHSFI